MWSDRESDKDYLNFSEVSGLAVDILTSKNMLPVSLGIFGNWGVGKSSLLNLIRKEILSRGEDHLVINFDAWLYQGYDDARVALLEVIARELDKAAKGNQTLASKTKSLLARVNTFRVLGLIAEGTALAHGIPTGGILAKGIGAIDSISGVVTGKEEATGEVVSGLKDTASEVVGSSKSLINDVPENTPPQQIDAFRKEYGEILEEFGVPLVVIIDNLDRCLPTNAIQTLEAIRLFLFLPKTAFVISADEEMIRGAVGEYFKSTSPRHQIDYLDKLIQVPIRVPKAGLREIRAYLFMLFAIENNLEEEKLENLRTGLEKSLQDSWKEEPIDKNKALELTGHKDEPMLSQAFDLADRIAPILANSPIIHGNPRIVKRLLNVIKMRNKIAKRRGMPLDEAVIAKLVIFERCAGAEATDDLYKLIDAQDGKPEALKTLEESDSLELPDSLPQSWKKDLSISSFIQNWSRLEPSLKNIDLRPAIYLSRETMPIGAYVLGLSPSALESMKALAEISNLSSPSGNQSVENLSHDEHVPVMQGLIDHLRQVSDWTKQPKGFAGACLLAKKSTEAASMLRVFIGGLGESPPWMKAMINEEKWNK